MYSTILPGLMTIVTFILTLLCLMAGHSPQLMQDYALLGVNVTELKSAHNASKNTGLPIHDSYNVFMRTHCAGYFSPGLQLPLVSVTCSRPVTYEKFVLGDLITNDLESPPRSPETLTSLNYPNGIDTRFIEKFNPQFHAAFAMYTVALAFVSLALLWGIVACFKGSLASKCATCTGSAATFLFIASVITTVVISKATSHINALSAPNITASYNSNFLKLTWSAFVVNGLSTTAWTLAAVFSRVYRAKSVNDQSG